MMSNVDWETCPEPTQRQIRTLLAGLQNRLATNLMGVYLHGSLAMGCFNVASSDIDLLAVVRRTIPLDTKKSLVEFLLRLSGSPHPLEISFLRVEDMVPWRYPAPFDLHYSEEWRKRYGEDRMAGAWERWDKEPRTDPDLAAHITVVRARGIRLWGKSIEETFPEIPRKDYLAALIADLEWAEDRVDADAVYGVLNACRVFAYLQDGRVYSKAEGAARGLKTLPAEFHTAIERALAISGGRNPGDCAVDPGAAKRLLNHVISKAQEVR